MEAAVVGAMALPTFSLQCPSSSRGISLRQVGSCGKFGGRTSVMLAWRRRSPRGLQRSGAVRVMAMAARKKAAGKDGDNERPELKLDANDLKELEFGRLLGEPHQATLAKVIGRKVNSSASYLDIEKKTIEDFKISSSSELQEAEFARLLNKEGRRTALPLEGVYKPQKVVSEDDLPGLVKPPSRPGQPLPQAPRRRPSEKSPKAAQGKKAVPLITFGPDGYAAQANKARLNEDDYLNLVHKPAISSPDSFKPSWPKLDMVPPMLLSKSKKADEGDYMDRVQKPAIPNPDSVKPSWPKNDSVPPMSIGEAKKTLESVDDSLLRRPMPGDTSGSSDFLDSEVESMASEDPKELGKPSKPKRSSKKGSASPGPIIASPSSDVSEEQFAKLLGLADSTGDDQDVPSQISMPTTVENVSKPKRTVKVGRKPVLAAKLPVQEDEIRQVGNGGASILASSSDLPMASLTPADAAAEVEAARLEENAEPIFSGEESDVDLSEDPTVDVAKEGEKQSDPEQSILRLVKKASRIAPVRPPKRFPKTIPAALKAKVADDRLAGWSEEVKAAVKRSEAALPNSGTPSPSESEFDQLLEQRKAELLRQRPVAPPMPETSLDPVEVSRQQRAASRPVVPSPRPSREAAPANSSQQSGVFMSDKRIPSKEEEDQDWARAEALRESKTVEEVVFTRAISSGMLAIFGSVVGFLAAYELSSRRRPPSFSTWAQEKGLKINRKLNSPGASENDDPDSEGSEGTERIGGADEEYKRLMDLYKKFRLDLLSALVGQTAKVVVVTVDRERKQLRFSEKEAEGEGQELAQKRAELMTNLNVGDAVKCTVKKVTNFGAFVELQGVPALIHISELSWNRVTDPSTILNVGQEVTVKVCRLDRFLQRISLSLKQMQPDPLRETLESLELRGTAIDDEDTETSVMPELTGLAKRLEAYKGIDSVNIGRRLQGNALAPTFQVYLSDHLDDGFKLLARSGNLVQEVLVQTALDRESMKDAIRQCTFSDN